MFNLLYVDNIIMQNSPSIIRSAQPFSQALPSVNETRAIPDTEGQGQRSTCAAIGKIAKCLARATGVHQLRRALGYQASPSASVVSSNNAVDIAISQQAESFARSFSPDNLVAFRSQRFLSENTQSRRPRDAADRSALANQLAERMDGLPALHASVSQGKGMQEISCFLTAFNQLIQQFPELDIDPNLKLSPLVASSTDKNGLQAYSVRRANGSITADRVSEDFRYARLSHEIENIGNMGTRLDPDTHAYSDFCKMRRTIVNELKVYENADQVPLADTNHHRFILLAQDRETLETQGAINLRFIQDGQSLQTSCIFVEQLLSSQSSKGVGKLLMLGALGMAQQESIQHKSNCPLALDALNSSAPFYRRIGLISDESLSSKAETISYSSGKKSMAEIVENFFSQAVVSPNDSARRHTP